MRKPVPTERPLSAVIRERWSQFAFDPSAEVSREEMLTLLEAARWSPSSSNIQPWRFIVGLNRDETHAKLVSCLDAGNLLWAPNAGMLVCACADTVHPRTGQENFWAKHDLGMSVGFLLLQAVEMGLACHPMGGFSREKVRQEFDLAQSIEPVTMIAVGRPGNPDSLPDEVRRKQNAPRNRRDAGEILIRPRR